MKADLTIGDSAIILAACRKHGLSPQETAYVMATAYWETNGTMKPVREAYYLGQKAEAYRKKLYYYPAYGRGYVQLTHHTNYENAGKKLGVDLANNYDLAMQPEIAAEVLVRGSQEGWFTGRKLSNYIGSGGADYVGARRIINGKDKATEIAAVAEAYEAALQPVDTDDLDMLKFGDRGAQVTMLQEELVGLGLLSTNTYGYFGNKTLDAVKKYQRLKGLQIDGKVGPKTWAALLGE